MGDTERDRQTDRQAETETATERQRETETDTKKEREMQNLSICHYIPKMERISFFGDFFPPFTFC